MLPNIRIKSLLHAEQNKKRQDRKVVLRDLGFIICPHVSCSEASGNGYFYCKFTEIPALNHLLGICTKPVSTYSVLVILEASTKKPSTFIRLKSTRASKRK